MMPTAEGPRGPHHVSRPPRDALWGMIEMVRRLGLLVGLVTAVALAFWTQFEPYLMVSLATPDEVARAENRPEPDARRPGALLDRPITRKGDGGLLTVSGPEWEALFSGVTKTFTDNYPIPGWEHRIQKRDLARARKDNERRGRMTAAERTEEEERVRRLKAQYGVDVTFRGSFRQLYFLAKEAPFVSAVPQWRVGTRYVLQRAEAPDVRLSVAYLSAYELHGFSDVITLPEDFSYPYRRMAPWAALTGLIAYLLLPWRRRQADILAYARWRVVLGDAATGLLMFGVFFAMPIAIIGGTLQAVTSFLPFTVIFWLVAAAGLVGLYWSTWTAAYRLAILPEGLSISTLLGSRAIAFGEIRMVQPVRLRPPKWLIVLSWLTLLLGRSPGATVGQAGRALLLEASGTNGLWLDLADASRIYIWYSDQMGQTSLPQFERLGQALHRESIRWGGDPVEIRALFPPTS